MGPLPRAVVLQDKPAAGALHSLHVLQEMSMCSGMGAQIHTLVPGAPHLPPPAAPPPHPALRLLLAGLFLTLLSSLLTLPCSIFPLVTGLPQHCQA